MALAILFLVAPVVIYLVLVCVPPGRFWRLALCLISVFLVYLWLGYLMAWPPFWTGNARADNYMLLAANIYTLAAGVGALTATFGRMLAARVAALSYSFVAALSLLITFIPLFILLGV